MNWAYRTQNTDCSFLNAKYCVCLFKQLAHETSCGSLNTPRSREDKSEPKCVVETVLPRGSLGSRGAGQPGGGALQAEAPGNQAARGPLGGGQGRAQARAGQAPKPNCGHRNSCLGVSQCESMPAGIYLKMPISLQQQTTHLLSMFLSTD